MAEITIADYKQSDSIATYSYDEVLRARLKEAAPNENVEVNTKEAIEFFFKHVKGVTICEEFRSPVAFGSVYRFLIKDEKTGERRGIMFAEENVVGWNPDEYMADFTLKKIGEEEDV